MRVNTAEITSNLFPLLGVRMFLGRNFLPEEDQRNGAPVVIVSYNLWQRRFGSSPAGIGSIPGSWTLEPLPSSGVLPAGFRLVGNDTDVFTLLSQDPAPFLQRRGPHPVGSYARLQPGATLAQAKAELAVIGSQLAAQYPGLPIKIAASSPRNSPSMSTMCAPRCGCC